MQSRHAFSACHPAVLLVYFCAVLAFAACLTHPVALAVSLLFAALFLLQLGGAAKLLRTLRFLLPLGILTAILNPLFNHRGKTILFYLPNQNPVTLESLAFGAATGALVLGVLLWFQCLFLVLSGDQLIHLFGKALPTLALLLSATLRFAGQFPEHFRAARDAQAALGNSLTQGPLRARLQTASLCFSAVAARSLEQSIETADSMKSRGYGLPGRTAYSPYVWTRRDKYLLSWMLGCVFFLACASFCGAFFCRYDPSLQIPLFGSLRLCSFAAWAALCSTPVLLHRKEARVWNCCK